MGFFCNLKILPIIKNRPTGENSSSLVTLFTNQNISMISLPDVKTFAFDFVLPMLLCLWNIVQLFNFQTVAQEWAWILYLIAYL
jgi:hypothetical protein